MQEDPDAIRGLTKAEQNLLFNFPDCRILSDSEIKNLLGPHFRRIIDQVLALPSSFGLCAVLAVHACGILTVGGEWLNIEYDPKEYKRIFDETMINKTGNTAWQCFEKQFHHLFPQGLEYHTIENYDQFLAFISNLEPNTGLLMAIICQYQQPHGSHTHWLAVLPADNKEKYILIGDLTPFGITDSIAIEVPVICMMQATRRLIGFTPDHEIADQLQSQDQIEGERETPQFRYNFATISFA